jgi:hypothetical protein
MTRDHRRQVTSGQLRNRTGSIHLLCRPVDVQKGPVPVFAFSRISARLALLNTEHAGRLELSTPAPQQFNHAIFAVPKAGRLALLRPDHPLRAPGAFSRPSDADRPALLACGGAAAEFAQVPPRESGAVEYAFDLAMQPDGGLERLRLNRRDTRGRAVASP